MRLKYLVALVMIAAGTPLNAQWAGPIELAPEQAATIRLDLVGKPVGEIERSVAQWSAHEIAVTRRLVAAPTISAPMENAVPITSVPDDPGVAPVPANMIRLRFFSIAEKHSLLIVDNGYDRPIAYRARMTVAGAARPTDVCIVIPHSRSFEHWPEKIEAISIADIRFTEWQAGGEIPCS